MDAVGSLAPTPLGEMSTLLVGGQLSSVPLHIAFLTKSGAVSFSPSILAQ